jgi:hypothetical protein
MRRMGATGICMAVVLAGMAIAAGGALAASPEYLLCAKAPVKDAGTFNDKSCTIPSKGGAKEGKYELAGPSAAKKATFTGSVAGFDDFLTLEGHGIIGDISCVSGKLLGEVTGAKTSTLTITLRKCTSNGHACSSSGAKAGELISFPLSAELLSAAGSATGVGQQLTGDGPGGELLKFLCNASVEEIVTGAVTGEVTASLGHVSKEQGTTFATGKDGKQLLSSPEPLIDEIVGEAIAESGVNATFTFKGEALEIA